MTKSKYRGATHKSRINHMRIALGLTGITVNGDDVLDALIRVFDGVEELKGDFSVRDAAKIQAEVEAIYKKSKKKADGKTN